EGITSARREAPDRAGCARLLFQRGVSRCALSLSDDPQVPPSPPDGAAPRRDLRRSLTIMSATTEGPVTWSDTSVLITGGTGSFGNKFVETMLARHRPRRLCAFTPHQLNQ